MGLATQAGIKFYGKSLLLLSESIKVQQNTIIKMQFRFSGRIRTIYRRNLNFYNKKNPSPCNDMAIQIINFIRPLSESSFQVTHPSFWITKGIDLTRVSFDF
jgi:hypothetical protein